MSKSLSEQVLDNFINAKSTDNVPRNEGNDKYISYIKEKIKDVDQTTLYKIARIVANTLGDNI